MKDGKALEEDEKAARCIIGISEGRVRCLRGAKGYEKTIPTLLPSDY